MLSVFRALTVISENYTFIMTSVLSVYFWNSSFRSARILSSKRSLLLSLPWSFVLSSSSPVPPSRLSVSLKLGKPEAAILSSEAFGSFLTDFYE